MNTNNDQENVAALSVLLQASLWDFPLAVQKWALGSDGKEVEEAVLKACQAWTNIANQAMERIFEAEGFVGLMTASVRHLAQWQRVSRDLVESMTHEGGAKSTSEDGEVKELREGVNRLRRDVRALTARVNLISAGHRLEPHAGESKRDEVAPQ